MWWGVFGPKGAAVFFVVLLSWYFIATRRQNKEMERLDRFIDSAKDLLDKKSQMSPRDYVDRSIELLDKNPRNLKRPSRNASMVERDPPSPRSLSLWANMASQKELFRTGGVAKSTGIYSGPLQPDLSRKRLELDAWRLRDLPPDEWLASTEALYYVPSDTTHRDAVRFSWENVKSITQLGSTPVAPSSVFVTLNNISMEGLDRGVDLQLAEGAASRLIAIFDEFRQSS